jgi:hypothetical protein
MFSCWSAGHLSAERQSVIGKLIGHLAMPGMHPHISASYERTQCPFVLFFLVFIVLEPFCEISPWYMSCFALFCAPAYTDQNTPLIPPTMLFRIDHNDLNVTIATHKG